MLNQLRQIRRSVQTEQSVLNAAARLAYCLHRSDHITDALVYLHWLRVPERVRYKIAVLVYKVLHDSHLGPLRYVADLPGCRPLHSAGTNCLAVPPVKLTTVANRAFAVVSPRTWNDLLDDVTSAEWLSIFLQRIKTHLFAKSYSDYSLDWTSSNLSLMDLAVVWITLGHFGNPRLID